MYEFDACPFCKKVREMATYLDLDCEYRPCPQGSPNHRPEAVSKSGKSRFPFMEDPNTGRSMLESDDIIKYLADTYGDGTIPFQLRLGGATVLTAGLGTLGRCVACCLVMICPIRSAQQTLFKVLHTFDAWRACVVARRRASSRMHDLRPERSLACHSN